MINLRPIIAGKSEEVLFIYGLKCLIRDDTSVSLKK